MNRILQTFGVALLAGIAVFSAYRFVRANDRDGWAADPKSAPIDTTTVTVVPATTPAGLAVTSVTAPATAGPANRPVDLAICLDTSGSMEGLIDAARRKLWDITNELATAKPTPRLRVALLTYGNDGHNAETGWVRVDSGFTEDLDGIYQRLFALTTNGGTEFVGRVLKVSVEQLDWTPSQEALKLIFVAGNESADQDTQVPFRDMCRKAIGQGIMVNAIYCGPAADGIAPAWREVALLADGQFASIDQNNGTVEVTTPYDQALAVQSTALNATYLPIGGEGMMAWQNQSAQDANAASLSGAAAASRAQSKSGKCYVCNWDLVDAVQQKEFDWLKVKDEDLPVTMRTMSLDQRKAHVVLMAQNRAGIQKQINDLNVQRQAYITAELKKQGLDGKNAFDAAVKQAVRQQAEKKGFEFEK